LSREEGLR